MPGSWPSPGGPAGDLGTVGWASPTFPPCCHWRFSGIQWELPRGWCPQRLSWEGTVGVTPEKGKSGQLVGAGGRMSGANQCQCLEANRSLPRAGFAPQSPGACGRIRAPSCLHLPQTWVPWSERPQRGSPKQPQAARGHPLLTSPLTVSSVGRKMRRWPRWWRTSSQQSPSCQDEPYVRGQR